MKFEWLDKKEYPFQSHFFNVNGVTMHYLDEGQGDVILFVHGTPSWSFDFRNVIKVLRKQGRCIAIDHVGFGLSDKPERYDYSTKNHSKTLEKFVFENGLNNITMVVHDFGGPIGLNFAIQYPERIKKLVILNSWLWSSESDPDFKKMKRILRNPLVPFLYRYLNFSPRFILPQSFGDRRLSKNLIQQYTKPFQNRFQRNGVLAFAQSLLTDQPWFEQIWSKVDAISKKPTLFIWGISDPVIKPLYLTKFQSAFTNARTLMLENTGHFPQEEQSEMVAIEIQEFFRIDSS